MNVLAVISPGLKVLFERVGKPEIVNRPNLFRSRSAVPSTIQIKEKSPRGKQT